MQRIQSAQEKRSNDSRSFSNKTVGKLVLECDWTKPSTSLELRVILQSEVRDGPPIGAMVAGLANTAEYCHSCQSKEPANSNPFNHGTDPISWRWTSAHFSHGKRRTIELTTIYQVAFSVYASIPESKQQGEKDCQSSLCTTNCSVEPWSSLERDH